MGVLSRPSSRPSEYKYLEGRDFVRTGFFRKGFVRGGFCPPPSVRIRRIDFSASGIGFDLNEPNRHDVCAGALSRVKTDTYGHATKTS